MVSVGERTRDPLKFVVCIVVDMHMLNLHGLYQLWLVSLKDVVIRVNYSVIVELCCMCHLYISRNVLVWTDLMEAVIFVYTCA